MKNHSLIGTIKICLFASSLFAIVLLQSCSVKTFRSDSMPITHELWDTLLQKHVTTEGQVDYKGFIADSVAFNKYLTLLSNHHPYKKNWSEDEMLAYWINAYNAFTVKLIIDHYPVESIKDIKSGIPFINDVWEIEFFKIEGNSYNLNDLEHGIARKQFNEPRIHAAFNCASFSCPRLRNEAYTAKRLNEQLDDQMRYFINNDTKNKLSADKPVLSKLFKWYGGDFKKTGMSVREFVNQYAAIKINKDADIEYMDYLWTLNDKQ